MYLIFRTELLVPLTCGNLILEGLRNYRLMWHIIRKAVPKTNQIIWVNFRLPCFALAVDFLKVLFPLFVVFPQKHNNSPQLLNMHFYLTKVTLNSWDHELTVPAYKTYNEFIPRKYKNWQSSSGRKIRLSQLRGRQFDFTLHFNSFQAEITVSKASLFL